MADLLSEPFASNGDRLVGYDLRGRSQPVFGRGLDGDAKIRRVCEIGRQLADHYRSVAFGKSVGLDNDRRARLAIVASRRNGDQITATYLHRTLRPPRSIAARRARAPGRARRPALPPAFARPANGHRQRQGATRAGLVRAAAVASPSSSLPTPPFGFSSRNALHRNALRVETQGDRFLRRTRLSTLWSCARSDAKVLYPWI